jgi:uncharacterized protein YrzB (UPF0473 family)
MPIEPENGEGHVDAFDEAEDLDEDDLVTITDEDGNDVDCAILAVIEHGGAEYALLSPVDQLEAAERDDGGQIDMYIFAYAVDEQGQQLFSSVDDDAVYEAVREEFSLLIDQERAEIGEAPSSGG